MNALVLNAYPHEMIEVRRILGRRGDMPFWRSTDPEEFPGVSAIPSPCGRFLAVFTRVQDVFTDPPCYRVSIRTAQDRSLCDTLRDESGRDLYSMLHLSSSSPWTGSGTALGVLSIAQQPTKGRRTEFEKTLVVVRVSTSGIGIETKSLDAQALLLQCVTSDEPIVVISHAKYRNVYDLQYVDWQAKITYWERGLAASAYRLVSGSPLERHVARFRQGVRSRIDMVSVREGHVGEFLNVQGIAAQSVAKEMIWVPEAASFFLGVRNRFRNMVSLTERYRADYLSWYRIPISEKQGLHQDTD